MEKRAQAHDHDVFHGGEGLRESNPKVENQSPEICDSTPSSPQQPQPMTIPKTRSSPLCDELNSSPSPSRVMEQDLIESARAEMGEVREENERLKTYLDRITREYKALQMQFLDIVKQEAHDVKKQKPEVNHGTDAGSHDHNTSPLEEPELVSLSLGRVIPGSSSIAKDEKRKDRKMNEDQEGLALSLDCKLFDTAKSATTESKTNNRSRENSSEDPKEDLEEVWPPSKVLKAARSSDDEAVSQQNPAKKARVCVRARCDTPTMNDGCQWRKYGQKIAKGNPCPRAYYRCTVAPSCPVRKQVQRCAEDMSILITTYEGTHNHPLPISATAMASTTSAAASMLLSGSSTSSGSSQGGLPATAATDLQGLNFYLSDPSRSKQFFLPNSSLMTPSPSHPTITLDLTSSLPLSSSASSYLNQFSSGPGRYNSSTSLNFRPTPEFGGSSMPVSSWNPTGFLNYGAVNHQAQHILQNLPKTNNNSQDSIAATTKAITTDPNFQSALVAALKSIISSGGSTSGGTFNPGNHLQVGSIGDLLCQKLSRNDTSAGSSGTIYGSQTPQANACGTSYLNKSGHSANAHQPTSLTFLQSNNNPLSFPLTSGKPNVAAASSGCEKRDRS